ncbi:MAG: DUF1349 domain-containing protein [Candidatus Sumerlaeia bacterium]
MRTQPCIRGLFLAVIMTATAAAGPIRSDDFSSTTLDTNLWTVVNPLGDGSCRMTGTQLALTIPAGAHIVNGVTNQSIRALQTVDDANFGLEIKFESPVSAPTGTIVMQGVLVQESATKFMRLGFDSLGASTRLYGCYFNGASSTVLIARTIYYSPTQPLYLKLQRAGTKWTISHSINGSTWITDGSFKAPLVMSAIGPFVGSQGTGVPGFTGVFDYFFDAQSPISPEDAKTLTVATAGSGSVATSPTLTAYPIGTTVTLTAQPSACWSFDHWSGDAGGTANPARIVIDANKLVTATFAEFIGDIAIQAGRRSAVVTWTTDRPATGRVDYGLTSALELGAAGDDTLTTQHSLTLSNLADATTYLCRITSTAETGEAQSAELSLTTPTLVDYTLTVGADGGGTVTLSPDQASYAAGTSVTLTAIANAGWRFSGWSGGLSGPANPAAIAMTTNTTVAALFEPFTITIDALDLTTNSAQIVWSTNFPSTGVVDFGLTTDYELGQVACGDLGAQHTATISGIDTSQTHHYRIVARDEGGCTASTGDLTLFLEPGGIVSDDFSQASLNPFWTFVNPLGDGSYALTGTQLTISVPLGTSHDVWSTGIDAPRVMQAADDGDFGVEVKFESAPSAKYQMQGILVEQDATHHLRFDFYSDGTRLYAYAAYITDTAATTRILKTIAASNPIWLHVTRSGEDWLMEYSADGANWSSAGLFTQAFTMTSIGPFAGNFSGPAYTAAIDYFFNDAAPIVPEDGPGLSLTVNTSGQGTALRTPDKSSYTTGEVVEVAAAAAPSWRFAGWSGDTTGTLNPVPVTMTRDWAMTANFQQFIVDPRASAQENAATITWTTPEPATSRVDYGPTADYGTTAQDAALATTHSLTLAPLAEGTLYHYRIASADAGGTATSSADMTFSTGSSAAIVSDDFLGATLKPIWTFVNPLSDATLTMTGTQARIDVPAGTHELWTSGMMAPRLEQQVADAAFEIEAKFESTLSAAYQEMGVFARESANKFLRIEFYHDGSRTHLYAAALLNGSPTTFFDKTISTGNPQLLRVGRAGDTWTVSYQTESAGWTAGGSFTYAMAVAAVGPHAGNLGAANTVIIDYFFNTATPISPEDNASYSLTVNVNGNGSVTREPDQSAYQAGEVVTLTAIPGDATTQFAGWSGALTGSQNPAQLTIQGDSAVTANFAPSSATTFDIWYGDTQRFGQIGKPQVWVDVLGTVSDGDGISALTYSLNGGEYKALSVGPDGRRLQGAGDFDVQLAFTELAAGTNTIVLRAVDSLGNVTLKTVTVDYIDGVIPDTNLSAQWTTTTLLTETVQPVDGRWSSSDAGAKNGTIGYDRLIAIGDMSWTDYEITVPITVHSWDPAGIGGINGYPGAGFILRWNGHTNDPPVATQPLSGWNPFGNVVWYHWDDGGGVSSTFEDGNLNDTSGQVLQLNVPYIYKVRVETVPGVGTLYSKKVWPQASVEPTSWTKQAYGVTAVGHGSILFLAHWTQMTVGDITIRSTVAPINSISVSAGTSQAAISWQTTQPRTSVVDYGLTAAYELGRVSDATLRTSHTLSLGGLAQGTLYHYRISGAAADGTTESTSDMTFQSATAQTIRSDNFNATALDASIWTFVNPVGDATLTMNGSEAQIYLPAGSDHDAWTAGNRTGRLMQPANDGDFQIEAGFTSSLTATYQFHGLIVEQDATHYLRFDAVRSGGSVYAYCAQLSGTSVSTKLNRAIPAAAPLHLRVGRSGSTWTYDYSTDGTTWTRAVSFNAALTVTKVGVMVGNAEGSSSPAYAGRIDYFNNTAAPAQN